MGFRISVVIPTYNRVRFLPFAIESALNQVVPPCEILVIDDASTDETPEWIQRHLGHHPKVRYIRSLENQGPHGARCVGAEQATGEFLAFLDSDDMWLPHHLEVTYKAFASNSDLVAVLTQRGEIDEVGRITRNIVRESWSGDLRDVLLKRVIFHPSRLTIRKDVFLALSAKEYHGESIRFGEDYVIGAMLSAAYGSKIAVLPDRTVWMRAHGYQSYHQALPLKRDLLKAVDVIFSKLPELQTLRPVVEAANLCHAAYFLWRTGNWRMGWQTLGEALRLYPGIVRYRDFWITVSRLILPPKIRRIWIWRLALWRED